MIVAAFTLFVIGFLIRHHYQCNECLAAINAMCDASKAFTDWRLRNQGVYIGFSEEGRLLLGRYLEAYDWFLRTHKFIDGTKHREWLVSMFYDFPPKHPDGLPGEDKRGIQQDAPSFSIPEESTKIFLSFDKLRINNNLKSPNSPSPSTDSGQASQWFGNPSSRT